MSAGPAPSSLPSNTPSPFHPGSYFTGKRLRPPSTTPDCASAPVTSCSSEKKRALRCLGTGGWLAIIIAAAAANVYSPAPTRQAPLRCSTLHVRLTPTWRRKCWHCPCHRGCGSTDNLITDQLTLSLPPTTPFIQLLWASSASPPLLFCSYLRLSHHRRSPFIAKPPEKVS